MAQVPTRPPRSTVSWSQTIIRSSAPGWPPVIAQEPDLQIMGEADNGELAVRSFASTGPTRPDGPPYAAAGRGGSHPADHEEFPEARILASPPTRATPTSAAPFAPAPGATC